ncbi:MAG: class I SAM-dependent methyltransferase [Calditrichaceae bacterium]|nr:class I SAM-dependent methyltransferase [Calditrichaceae bacterium]RQV96670.1 MAG: class I SAM-dependent methyltransferase [Calditrichota bacterium]
MAKDKNRVCPVEMAGSLDSKMRKWIQNPYSILKPYIKEGMAVLDLGCGPGFFSIPLADMVGENGKVIAADLQEGMLQKVKKKTFGTVLDNRILFHKCDKDKIGLTGKVDFILAYYMVHEAPDKAGLFRELKTLLNKNGKFLLVEPRLFHVSKKDFDYTLEQAVRAGFQITDHSKSTFEWSALLK